MLYIVNLSTQVCIENNTLSSGFKNVVTQKLKKLEGTIFGNAGLIVSVLEFTRGSNGYIDNDTGSVMVYDLSFKAIVHKQDAGEVTLAVVTDVKDFGFFCETANKTVHHFVSNRYSTRGANSSVAVELNVTVGQVVLLEVLATKMGASEIRSIAVLADRQ